MNGCLKAIRWIIVLPTLLILSGIILLSISIIPIACKINKPGAINQILDRATFEERLLTILSEEDIQINSTEDSELQVEIIKAMLSNPEVASDIKEIRTGIVNIYYQAAITGEEQSNTFEINLFKPEYITEALDSNNSQNPINDVITEEYNKLPTCTEIPTNYTSMDLMEIFALQCKIPGYQPNIDSLDINSITNQNGVGTNSGEINTMEPIEINISTEQAINLNLAHRIIKFCPIAAIVLIISLTVFIVIMAPARTGITVTTAITTALMGILNIVLIYLLPLLILNLSTKNLSQNSNISIDGSNSLSPTTLNDKFIPFIQKLLTEITKPSLIISIIAVTIGIISTITILVIKMILKKNRNESNS